jgi:PAS domain S-box-containing protein
MINRRGARPEFLRCGMESKEITSTVLCDSAEYNRILNTLKVSETRFRRLFETAQDGILILDADTGQINEVNKFLIDMLGYSRDEFLGKKLWEIGAFRDVKAIKAEFSKLQKKRYVRYEDLPLQARDGHKIEVEFVSNIYKVDDKKVIQCNIRDITARKKAENDLKEAHETLEFQVIERTAELLKTNQKLKDEIFDRKNRDRFIFANNLLLKLLGKPISPQEYVDTLVKILRDWSRCSCLGIRITNGGTQLHYDSYQGFRQAYWVSQTGLSIEEYKGFTEGCFQVTKGGSFYYDTSREDGGGLSPKLKERFQNIGIRKPYVLVIIPVFYNKKTIALIYLADKKIAQDILAEIMFIERHTPLIGESIYKFNMEAKMRETQQELAQAKRLSDIGTLSATVAHELRNPLAAINLAVYNIRRKKQDLPIDKHLDNIDKKNIRKRSDHK